MDHIASCVLFMCLQHQHRVPGTDEEGDQVTAGDGRAQHPQRAAAAGAAGRPARKDPEGARRIPGAGTILIPKVGTQLYYSQ